MRGILYIFLIIALHSFYSAFTIRYYTIIIQNCSCFPSKDPGSCSVWLALAAVGKPEVLILSFSHRGRGGLRKIVSSKSYLL